MQQLKPSRLNNMRLSFQRRDLNYEAVMTDLYLMGALPKEIVEKFTGRAIPDHITLPPGLIMTENGVQIADEEASMEDFYEDPPEDTQETTELNEDEE